MTLYAGIDAGQSGTTALIGDRSGRVLGRGSAGPADEIGQGPSSTRLRDALRGALTDAIRDAGLPSETRFDAVVVGLSGYEGRVYGQPPELPAQTFTLLHDAPIAHAGALGGGPGIVVIAGTGSAAYGVDENGNHAGVGGWGYVFGDEGSAFAIARSAVAHAMRESDAGTSCALEALALREFEQTSLHALARSFYAGTISRAAFAGFAERVIASSGRDACAARFVDDAAGALVALVVTAASRLRMTAPDVAFAGGLLRSPAFCDRIACAMRDRAPHARVVEPRHDAAMGALLLAIKQ